MWKVVIAIVAVASLTLTTCYVFNDTATTEIYTLSLYDALPIYIDGARRLVDGGGHLLRVVRVHERRLDAEARERVLEQREGAAVERRRRDDGVARLGEVQERERLRGLPARRRDGRDAALELGEPLLEDVGRGVHEARVDV